MRHSPLARLVALAVLLQGCGGGEGQGEAAPPPSVTVARVLRARIPDERERIGQVQAVEDVDLRARIPGFLESRNFEEGADVEQGDLLFMIERGPYEARMREAEAELARAAAALHEAQLELDRTRQLHRRNVASAAALDQAVAREAGLQAEQMAAQASLHQALLDFRYTEIHAPVSGRVGRAHFSVGDLVGPESGTLATLATLDPIHVYWQVPEAVLLEFRRANAARERDGDGPLQVTARLRLSDGSVYEHEGRWDFLDNRVDPTTGTQTARAVFPNPDRVLLPGQYAQVIVEVGQPRETLVIPQSAVQEDQAGRFVLVVDDEDAVQLRRVTMGTRQDVHWEVREGLAEGERVVYQGVQKVQPGQRVAPVEMPPESPAGPRPEPASGAPPPPRADPPPAGG